MLLFIFVKPVMPIIFYSSDLNLLVFFIHLAKHLSFLLLLSKNQLWVSFLYFIPGLIFIFSFFLLALCLVNYLIYFFIPT